MHPLVKASAVALVGCGFLGNLASSARAANCLPEQDNEALHVASVQQQLIVASSACHEITSRYALFLQRYHAGLQESDETLTGFFTQHNPQTGAADLKTFRAKLATIASLRYAREPLAYCQQATQLLIGALGGRAALGSFAATQPVEFEMPYIACETKPPVANLAASARPQIPARPAPPNQPVKIASAHPAGNFAVATAAPPARTPPPKLAQVASAKPVDRRLALNKPQTEISPRPITTIVEHSPVAASLPAEPTVAAIAASPAARSAVPSTTRATSKPALAAILTVRPPIFPTSKPSAPEPAPSDAAGRVEHQRMDSAPQTPERDASAVIQPPIFPKMKPAAPADPATGLARNVRNGANGRTDMMERSHPHIRLAMHPPVFPTAKPFIAPLRPVAIARAEPRNPIRPAISKPRATHDVRIAASERHDRSVTAARNVPERIARNDGHPETEKFETQHLSASLPLRVASTGLEQRTRRVALGQEKAPGRSSTSGALADINRILASLTAPIVTPAAAHPATASTGSSGGESASSARFVAQAATRQEQDPKGPDRSAVAPSAPSEVDSSGRNRRVRDEGHDSTFAQNDDDYAGRDSEDQAPPVRFRGRHGRSWDSLRGRDSSSARWDSQADEDNQGDDDNSGYAPTERRDENYRGSWY